MSSISVTNPGLANTQDWTGRLESPSQNFNSGQAPPAPALHAGGGFDHRLTLESA